MLEQPIHRKFMLQILLMIYKQSWSKNLAFKWWTMLYLFHSLNRFSTDLDFDIIDVSIEQKDLIINQVKTMITEFGEIKNETKRRLLHRLIFSYGAGYHNVKLEFNTRVSKYNKYAYSSLLGQNVLCMDKSSAFSNKLLALSDRVANRDLYDVRRMDKQKRVFDPQIIQERTWKSIWTFFEELELHVKANFSSNMILGQLWVVLSDKQKIEVKANLLSEVVQLIGLWKLSYK